MALEADLKSLSIDTAPKTEDTSTFKHENQDRDKNEANGSSSEEPVAPQTASSEPAAKETQSDSSCMNVPDVVAQCDKNEYLVKTIDWKDKQVRIITQNGNVRALNQACVC